MTCQEVAHSEIVERYIAGSLPPEQAGQFEEHFFACAACLARLEAAQSLAADWPALVHAVPRATPRWMPLAALAASLLVAATAALFWRSPPRPPAPVAQTPARQPAAPAAVAYAALGRFEPPPYRQVALRGAGDKADDTFRRAMRAYQDRRFTDALPLLRTAAAQPFPGAAILFFAGVTSVLAGEPAEGLEFLRRAEALGLSAYQEEARYYSALTQLQLGDLPAARKQLDGLAAMHGDWEPKARELLQKLP